MTMDPEVPVWYHKVTGISCTQPYMYLTLEFQKKDYLCVLSEGDQAVSPGVTLRGLSQWWLTMARSLFEKKKNYLKWCHIAIATQASTIDMAMTGLVCEGGKWCGREFLI